MAILGFQGLGNGQGYIYIVQGSRINTMRNTPDNRNALFVSALTAGPASGEAIATGSTVITGHAGTITNVTINGVSIMGAVAASGASDAALATDLASKVNSNTSTPDYTATTVGSTVIYYAAPGTGSGPNGFVVVSTATAGTTTVDSNMSGGSPASGVYDAVFGYQYYINDDPNTAAIGSLTAAVEISAQVISRSVTIPISKQTATNGTSTITASRNSSIQYVVYGQDGRNYDVISVSGAQDGDIMILLTANVAFGNSIRDVSVATAPGANILLNGAVTFTSGANTVTLTLRYSSSLNQWVEYFRTPGIVISTASFRAAGLAYPVDGTVSTAVTLAGATTTYTAGTSKKFQRITGTGVLLASSAFNLAGGAKDGDEFFIDYSATITYAGGFTITIAGLALTATQALAGTTYIHAYYDGPNSQWRADILQKSPVDLATTTQLATKEASLGNPATNAYVLASSTAGVRTWVPNASSPVYYAATGNTGNSTDTIIYVLKTYTVPGGTLVNNGDALEIEASFVCAANGHTKTMTLVYGATTIWTSAAQAFNGEAIIVKARVVVVDGTNESASAGTLGSNVLPITPAYTTPTETISTDILIQCTGQTGTAASAGDVICKHLTVKVVKHI